MRVSAALMLALVMAPAPAAAQSEPYKVFDTKAVFTEGPYLVGLSETSVSIVWMNDAPTHVKVQYGAGDMLDRVVEPEVDGLAPVGVRHAVTLTGLTPGTTYSYQVVATRVVKLKAYWPDKGVASESPVKQFTTFDRRRPTATLAAITDTHENTSRINALMKMVDWPSTDALVHLGDAFDWVDDEEQVYAKWLRPIVNALGGTKPLIYARGNHEMRGAFARQVLGYVPPPEGRFYYARDIGPIHLTVLDTGEDKPDATNVYADLNKTIPYRAAELEWFRSHLANDPRAASAPFRVVAMHQPKWGWLEHGPAEWMAAANDAKVDLVIAGHDHRFSYEPPNDAHRYHLVVVGQDQLAMVRATMTGLIVTITTDGKLVREIVVK